MSALNFFDSQTCLCKS